MSEQQTVERRGDTIAVKPLSPAVGGEVIGVDLHAELDDARFAWIREAWHRHCVLLFRDQHLESEDQLRFAGRFGELARNVNRHSAIAGHPSIMLVTNIREDGKPIGALPDGEMYFHSDQCYVERPSMATTLYAIDIPRQGGNTLFANMYLAYETLPDDIKRQIDGRMAMNVYDYEHNPMKRGSTFREGVPHCAHPIVRTHPATGRKALYVNRLMTDHIVGMPRDESDRLLSFLFDHQEQRRFVYEHRWRKGDLLVWDNRCVLHARRDFDAKELRKLRRVTVKGDRIS